MSQQARDSNQSIGILKVFPFMSSTKSQLIHRYEYVEVYGSNRR